MNQTPIPSEELRLFSELMGIEVVFDVGARTDLDYLEINPNLELHAFEPNPVFFAELERKARGKNVHLNNYGLGDIEGEFLYDGSTQSFDGGEAGDVYRSEVFMIRTLDSYVKENEVKRLDFLKIDTEGYDYKVLKGGKGAVELAKYIQYEIWNNPDQFEELLKEDFHMEYIGYRNVLCISKGKVPLEERDRILKFIRDNKYAELA